MRAAARPQQLDFLVRRSGEFDVPVTILSYQAPNRLHTGVAGRSMSRRQTPARSPSLVTLNANSLGAMLILLLTDPLVVVGTDAEAQTVLFPPRERMVF